MTAATALTDPVVAHYADQLRDHIAKKVRWAQHVAAGAHLTPAAQAAATQVADEIVRAVVAQFGGAR